MIAAITAWPHSRVIREMYDDEIHHLEFFDDRRKMMSYHWVDGEVHIMNLPKNWIIV